MDSNEREPFGDKQQEEAATDSNSCYFDESMRMSPTPEFQLTNSVREKAKAAAKVATSTCSTPTTAFFIDYNVPVFGSKSANATPLSADSSVFSSLRDLALKLPAQFQRSQPNMSEMVSSGAEQNNQSVNSSQIDVAIHENTANDVLVQSEVTPPESSHSQHEEVAPQVINDVNLNSNSQLEGDDADAMSISCHQILEVLRLFFFLLLLEIP